MSAYSPLASTVEFLVEENRNSDLPVKKREQLLMSKRTGRILSKLYPLGFFGGIIYCFGAVIRPPKAVIARDFIIEDHASNVVQGALVRFFGQSFRDELREVKPSRLSLTLSLLGNIPNMHRAYRRGKISHFTEYVRVMRILYFYPFWRAMFKTVRPECVLLARTNDQKRLALGATAQECGIRVGVFTVKRVGLRNPAPFSIHTQFCWTKRQIEHLRKQQVHAVRMPVPEIRPMAASELPELDKLTSGLLLNAKYDTAKVREFLEELSDNHGIVSVQVRPHPGTERELLSGLEELSVINDWHDPLESYLDSLDLVFALNTNAVIGALLHGIPVVYVGGLDPFAYDLHGFVREGIVLPYSRDFRYPQSVKEFYVSESFQTAWNSDEFTSTGNEEHEALLKLFEGNR